MDTIEILRTIIEYHEKLHANKLDYLEEMDNSSKFLTESGRNKKYE